jgi:dUTP pyrophosphatase
VPLGTTTPGFAAAQSNGRRRRLTSRDVRCWRSRPNPLRRDTRPPADARASLVHWSRVASAAVTDVSSQRAEAALKVLVQRLDSELPLPRYALPDDAGADIVAARDLLLAPGDRAVLPTGIAIALPEGYAAFVHPRSGLAARAGLGLVNAPGTIDAGYRGEIMLIVINHDSSQPLQLTRGERVAQLVFQRVERAAFVEVAELPPSARGTGGHGSTGGAAVLQPARPADYGGDK